MTFGHTLQSCTASKPAFVTHWLFGSCQGRIASRHHTSLEVCPLRIKRYFSFRPMVLFFVRPIILMAFSSSFVSFSKARRRRQRRLQSCSPAIHSFINSYDTYGLPLVVHDPSSPNLHSAGYLALLTGLTTGQSQHSRQDITKQSPGLPTKSIATH